MKISKQAEELAEENGVDLSTITGSGKDGAITVKDVKNELTPEPTAKAPKKKQGISGRGISPIRPFMTADDFPNEEDPFPSVMEAVIKPRISFVFEQAFKTGYEINTLEGLTAVFNEVFFTTVSVATISKWCKDCGISFQRRFTVTGLSLTPPEAPEPTVPQEDINAALDSLDKGLSSPVLDFEAPDEVASDSFFDPPTVRDESPEKAGMVPTIGGKPVAKALDFVSPSKLLNK